MLLARARASESAGTLALRGVFARDDAWLATGDLFRRDADGDYWRLDSVRDVIRTDAGPVFTAPIRDALGTLPAVDLAVAYGVPARGGHELAVAAVTLRHGHRLDARSLSAALRALPGFERPAVVQVVDEIPVTTWYRPLTAPLRAAGVPEPGERAWYLDRGGKTYRRSPRRWPLAEPARQATATLSSPPRRPAGCAQRRGPGQPSGRRQRLARVELDDADGRPAGAAWMHSSQSTHSSRFSWTISTPVVSGLEDVDRADLGELAGQLGVGGDGGVDLDVDEGAGHQAVDSDLLLDELGDVLDPLGDDDPGRRPGARSSRSRCPPCPRRSCRRGRSSCPASRP